MSLRNHQRRRGDFTLEAYQWSNHDQRKAGAIRAGKAYISFDCGVTL